MSNEQLAAKNPVKRKRSKEKTKKIVVDVIVKLILFILLLGFAYVIIYPFIFKISAAFMSKEDLYDSMVNLVPKHWSIENFQSVLEMDDIWTAFFNTSLYAIITGACAMASSALVGYGFAKFNFPLKRLFMAFVVLTMLIPSTTIQLSLFSTFRYFDIFGIIKLISGTSLQLTNTGWPFAILSATCLGFRGGIFVLLMMQYFKGVPKELVEAAYVDGAGPFYTFFKIMLPMAKSMMIVVFVLAFAWQYTDTFYSGTLHGGAPVLSNLISTITSVSAGGSSDYYYFFVLGNTAALLAILPLLLVYILLQRKIIQGIERSGLVG